MNETLAPRILLIDANPDGHSLLTQALDKTGIDLSSAFSSGQGVEMASGHHHDLILLDSDLPDLNGLLTLRLLKQTTKTAGFPVVFLVGNTEKDLIGEAYYEGAVDVLRKPLYPEELQARIRSVLKTQTMLHRLRYLSQNDPLTRLPNRNGMSQWIQKALDAPADFPPPYGVLVIGVDRLNNITESLGHGASEEVLRLVAMSLQSMLSQSSVMERCCKRFSLARSASDSFVLLMTGVEGSRTAMGLATALVEAIATTYKIGNTQQFLSASVGIAISREAQSDFHNLIRFADIAYQDARNAGRSHVQMYDPSMEEVLRCKLDVESDLRVATRNRNFLLEYQPVFNLQTKQCEFAETLIFWDRPNHGLIPLQRFRSIADENGFMGEIASWALSNACNQLSQWQHESSSDAPRRVSLDLSRKQLQHPQFIEAALDAIQQSRLRNDRVQFEISETDVMYDRDGMVETLKKMRESGIRIVIDDFGNSFHSFQCLDQFPVDGIKLSKALVQNVEINPLVVKLIEILVRQATQCNLTIVADGVEREAQAKTLSNLGIRFGQGTYYTKPMNGDSLIPFLSDWIAAQRNRSRGRMVPPENNSTAPRNSYR